MDRIQGIEQRRVDELREHAQGAYERGEEPYLEELDRSDRANVAFYESEDGEWRASELKRDDDVVVRKFQVRVIGPASGREQFLGYMRDAKFGELVGTYTVKDITDRAPVDSSENPMPIIPGWNVPPAPVQLEELRKQAFLQIDMRSDALISRGFVFQNVLFSLSLEAQIRYNAMMTAADSLDYPLDINSLDDTRMVQLHTPSDTRAFCLAALNRIKEVVDSGTVEKERVRAMDSREDLANFKDSREPDAE